MAKQKIIWEAVTGKKFKEFPTKEEALNAEETYKIRKRIDFLHSIFIKYFKEDRKTYFNYEVECVDCGKKLFEYEKNGMDIETKRKNFIFMTLIVVNFYQG